MREFYTSKVFQNRPLAWEIGYIVPQCRDTPNFIFAIKQGGFGLTLEVYNSLIAQWPRRARH